MEGGGCSNVPAYAERNFWGRGGGKGGNCKWGNFANLLRRGNVKMGRESVVEFIQNMDIYQSIYLRKKIHLFFFLNVYIKIKL